MKFIRLTLFDDRLIYIATNHIRSWWDNNSPGAEIQYGSGADCVALVKEDLETILQKIEEAEGE